MNASHEIIDHENNHIVADSSATSQPIATTSASEQTQLADHKDIANFGSRWIENSRFMTGASPEIALLGAKHHFHPETADPNSLNQELQLASIIENGSGMLLAIAFHYLSIKMGWYKKIQSVNPIYRNFKTLASIGNSVGNILANVLPFIPDHGRKYVAKILANVTSVVIGLFAVPYWLVRAKFMKSPPEERNVYTKTGREGWSKYAKTMLVFGTALGQLIGAAYGLAMHAGLTADIFMGGWIAGITTVALGLILVPVINKCFNKILINDDKNVFRNNYMRSGITLGTGIGATIGFVIGTFALPVIGSAAGMAIGAAMGAVIAGPVFGSFGSRINKWIMRKLPGTVDSENSWDYATRNASYVFGFLFAAVGFFIPVPGGALVGASLGAAFGSSIGWGMGLLSIKMARTAVPQEPTAATLPWTQRVATGATVAAGIGAALGFSLGLLGGPFGALGGAALGGAIGGFIGGVTGALKDKVARNVIAEIFRPTPKKPIASEVEVEAEAEVEIEVEANPAPVAQSQTVIIATLQEPITRPRSRSLDSSTPEIINPENRQRSQSVSYPSSCRQAFFTPASLTPAQSTPSLVIGLSN